MGKAMLNTGQSLYGIHDPVIGPRSHISARCTIASTAAGKSNAQAASSPLPVSGRPDGRRAIHAGWAAARQSLLHRPLAEPPDGSFPWDADYLHYFVREPFPSRTNAASRAGFYLTQS